MSKDEQNKTAKTDENATNIDSQSGAGVSRWRDIKEQFRPKMEGLYIICQQLGNKLVIVSCAYLKNGEFYSEEDYNYGDFSSGNVLTNITHWMPLPEPPSC